MAVLYITLQDRPLRASAARLTEKFTFQYTVNHFFEDVEPLATIRESKVKTAVKTAVLMKQALHSIGGGGG